MKRRLLSLLNRLGLLLPAYRTYEALRAVRAAPVRPTTGSRCRPRDFG